MVAKSIAKMYTNIHKPTDYNVVKLDTFSFKTNPFMLK